MRSVFGKRKASAPAGVNARGASTTVARLFSFSPRGTSGERDGERGCKN